VIIVMWSAALAPSGDEPPDTRTGSKIKHQSHLQARGPKGVQGLGRIARLQLRRRI